MKNSANQGWEWQWNHVSDLRALAIYPFQGVGIMVEHAQRYSTKNAFINQLMNYHRIVKLLFHNQEPFWPIGYFLSIAELCNNVGRDRNSYNSWCSVCLSSSWAYPLLVVIGKAWCTVTHFSSKGTSSAAVAWPCLFCDGASNCVRWGKLRLQCFRWLWC